MKLFIGNLSSSATEDDLRSAAAAFGEVTSVTLASGHGFVEMASAAEGQAALTGLNGQEIQGQAVKPGLSAAICATVAIRARPLAIKGVSAPIVAAILAPAPAAKAISAKPPATKFKRQTKGSTAVLPFVMGLFRGFPTNGLL
jgi:RNA recognition motif-containing protein